MMSRKMHRQSKQIGQVRFKLITRRVLPEHFSRITFVKGGRNAQISDRERVKGYVVSAASATLPKNKE
jgi:hypothetical protein